MKRFCYRCGASESGQGPLIQGLCQRCFTSENSLLKIPKKLEVTICKYCGAHLVGKRWREPIEGDPIEGAVRAITQSSLRIAHLVSDGIKFLRFHEAPWVEISVEPRLERGLVEIEAKGKISELQIRPKFEKTSIKFVLDRKTCDVCVLKSSRYYEAVLQIRGELTGDKHSEIKEKLERFIASTRDRRAFISSIEEQRRGLDIYVSSASLARGMAAMLRSDFGAKLKESMKLVGKTRNGHPKYKISIVARFGEF